MRWFWSILVGLAAALTLAGCGGEKRVTTPTADDVWAITDLGTMGGPESGASAINARGQIVGITESLGSHAFLLEDGEMRDLGTLGGSSSGANAMNDRGQVVGVADTERGDGHGFLWEDGEMRDLGVLGGFESVAVAINERGQVVGWADTEGFDAQGNIAGHAVLWESGEIRDLGTLGGSASSAWDVNDRGQVVGWADTKAKGESHGFLWESDVMRDLGDFMPTAINNRGEIVGDVQKTDREGNLVFHAVLWRNGSLLDLGTLGGPESYADGIDDSGRIVGIADMAKNRDGSPVSRAFLWERGKMSELRTPWTSGTSRATAINGTGQILGWGDTRNGERHAVLWTPKR